MSEGDGPPPDRLREPVVLALAGELDVAVTGEAYKRMLGLALRAGDQLVLDLSEVTFMDSAGIRLLLQARAHAESRRAGFAVVRGRDQVMRVLELVGLVDQLDLIDQLPA
jgi:stage II sporulation protein AA (anti-sigma F factor antagonist)